MNALTRLSAAPEKQPMADNTLKRPAPTARILAAVLGGKHYASLRLVNYIADCIAKQCLGVKAH